MNQGGKKLKQKREGVITICVGRPGETEKVYLPSVRPNCFQLKAEVGALKFAEDTTRPFLIAEGEASDVSSTKIRKYFHDINEHQHDFGLHDFHGLVEKGYETEEVCKYLIEHYTDLYMNN